MRTQGERAVEVIPVSLGMYQVRLVEAGQRYITPKYVVPRAELYTVMRGPGYVEVGDLTIRDSVGTKYVHWQGEKWLEIGQKDWNALWSTVTRHMVEQFGEMDLEQTIRAVGAFRKVAEERAQRDRGG